MKRTSNGRAWAYAGTALGGLVSIAANVAHSFVPPAGAPASWRPALGAPLLAVFWPVALFVAIEILTRTVWRRGWRYIALRFGGLIPVAGTAAIVSYMHLSGLLAHYAEPRITVVIGPLAVDGLMVMSASALMATSPAVVKAVPVTVPEPVPAQDPETPSEQPKERSPKPRRPRASRNTRKRTAPKRTEEQLLADATALNEDALSSTGKPVSARRLMTELRIGHPAAAKLLDALPATVPGNTPETAPEHAIEHANGRELAASIEGN